MIMQSPSSPSAECRRKWDIQPDEERELKKLQDSILPADVLETIKNFVVVNESDIPIPRWKRGGMHPLPLGFFRSSIVPLDALEGVGMEVELDNEHLGFSVEVSAKIISGRENLTEGIICDLGVAGLGFSQGDLVLWVKTRSGVKSTQVPASSGSSDRTRCHHFLFSITQGKEMVLYLDGVKVARQDLTERLEFKEEKTRIALTRCIEGSYIQACPEKRMQEAPTPNSGSDWDSYVSPKVIQVVPTKGSLGAARVYDFPLSAHQAHLAYYTGDHFI